MKETNPKYQNNLIKRLSNYLEYSRAIYSASKDQFALNLPINDNVFFIISRNTNGSKHRYKVSFYDKNIPQFKFNANSNLLCYALCEVWLDWKSVSKLQGDVDNEQQIHQESE